MATKGKPNQKEDKFLPFVQKVRVVNEVDNSVEFKPVYIAPDATDEIAGDVFLSDDVLDFEELENEDLKLIKAKSGITATTPYALGTVANRTIDVRSYFKEEDEEAENYTDGPQKLLDDIKIQIGDLDATKLKGMIPIESIPDDAGTSIRGANEPLVDGEKKYRRGKVELNHNDIGSIGLTNTVMTYPVLDFSLQQSRLNPRYKEADFNSSSWPIFYYDNFNPTTKTFSGVSVNSYQLYDESADYQNCIFVTEETSNKVLLGEVFSYIDYGSYIKNLDSEKIPALFLNFMIAKDSKYLSDFATQEDWITLDENLENWTTQNSIFKYISKETKAEFSDSGILKRSAALGIDTISFIIAPSEQYSLDEYDIIYPNEINYIELIDNIHDNILPESFKVIPDNGYVYPEIIFYINGQPEYYNNSFQIAGQQMLDLGNELENYFITTKKGFLPNENAVIGLPESQFEKIYGKNLIDEDTTWEGAVKGIFDFDNLGKKILHTSLIEGTGLIVSQSTIPTNKEAMIWIDTSSS